MPVFAVMRAINLISAIPAGYSSPSLMRLTVFAKTGRKLGNAKLENPPPPLCHSPSLLYSTYQCYKPVFQASLSIEYFSKKKIMRKINCYVVAD